MLIIKTNLISSNVIGGFSVAVLKGLTHVTVRLQVSDYSQLSDYTVRLHGPISKINWSKIQ